MTVVARSVSLTEISRLFFQSRRYESEASRRYKTACKEYNILRSFGILTKKCCCLLFYVLIIFTFLHPPLPPPATIVLLPNHADKILTRATPDTPFVARARTCTHALTPPLPHTQGDLSEIKLREGKIAGVLFFCVCVKLK